MLGMSKKGKRGNERTLLRNFETARRMKESVIVFFQIHTAEKTRLYVQLRP